MRIKRRSMFLAIIGFAVAFTMIGAAVSFDTANADDRVIRKLCIITRPQAAGPDEYETVNFLAREMKQLGLDIEMKAAPWEQQMNQVWFKRDSWDMTGWQMVARPERLDPDEFIFNLFHSSTAPKGYNFIGYINPEYDKLAEKQRATVDLKKRQALIYACQKMVLDDMANIYTVNPTLNYVYNNKVFDPASIKDMAGLGIKNFWTFTEGNPLGSQKSFILNTTSNVKSCNPFYISGSADSWVTELIWDRLMRMGVDGLPKPWAAESVTWLDNTTVKVVLREGMKWHDGKPVTVEDVKFSYEVPMTGESPMYKPFVSKIAKIDIVDNRTLVFKLKEPWSAFETASLAKLNLAPKHIWEPIIEECKKKPETAEEHQEKIPIGSGPFKFDHWNFNEEVVLVANKDHFQAPKVDKWILKIIPNMEAALGMISNGELNFLSEYSGDSQLLSEKVKADPKLTLVSSVDLGFRYVAVNLRRPPFSDKAFRRALGSLMDRQLIVDAVWKGFAVPCDSAVSPALKFWKNPNLQYPTGGQEAARKILKDAGYSWDKKGRLLYPEGQKETTPPAS